MRLDKTRRDGIGRDEMECHVLGKDADGFLDLWI